MNLKEKLALLNFSDSQKRLMKMLGIFIIAVIALIVVVSIVKSISGNKVSFEQLENIMVRAAENYVEADSTVIETEVYGTTRIDVSTLASKGYMKEIGKYTSSDVSCSGSVLVYRNLDYYTYIPKLSCGDEYETFSLAEIITDENNIVTSGGGLYEQDGKYVYRGEYVDNYIQFSNQLWRIISVDSEQNLRIVQEETAGRNVWDNRYNSDYLKYTGINDFEGVEPSRIKNSILAAYNDTNYITENAKKLIVPREYCIGKRALDDNSKDGSTECAVVTELMGASTPLVSDYLTASLDEKCVSIKSVECVNYNYMSNFGDEFWTVTAVSENTNEAFYISSRVSTDTTSYTKSLKLLVTVNGNVNYQGGTGTESDPYIIEETK